MIIPLPAPTVSDAVGALKRLVNRRLGHDIWQRSFHEHVIRNEQDYREIWEYIDQNPARWAEDRYISCAAVDSGGGDDIL